MSICSRTDLAMEAHENWMRNSASTSALQGVKARTDIIENMEITRVEIFNASAAEKLNKPMGKYLSLSFHKLFQKGSSAFTSACSQLSSFINELSGPEASVFLIAALGNPDITPDSLGPIAASNILVTHHLKQHEPSEFPFFGDSTLIRPGVLGTSGIESAAQIRAIAQYLKPDCIIVIDALAGSDIKRLCSCVQVSDSGIAPGSGVGNNRQEISSAVLGVPVISVGVPTVIDASSFSDEPGLEAMFVTPRDIDASVRLMAGIIACSINLAIHKDLSMDDLDMLLS